MALDIFNLPKFNSDDNEKLRKAFRAYPFEWKKIARFLPGKSISEIKT